MHSDEKDVPFLHFLIIILMQYIKQGYQHKDRDLYIDSIKKRFQKRQPKLFLKQLKTSPDRPQQLFFSPSINKILKKYQTINIHHSSQIPSSKKLQLPQLHKGSQERSLKKRWSEIQKDEYNSIRNQINVNKIKTPFAHFTPKKPLKMSSPQKFGNKFSSILIRDDNQKSYSEAKEKITSGGSWIDHIRNLNHQNSNHRRQSILRMNQGYLFPELLAKLPKINTYQQELPLARSMQIRNKQQQNIFCSRKIKRSQMKLRAQKMSEYASKRRRFHTVNYDNGHDSTIAPWGHPNVLTRSIFY